MAIFVLMIVESKEADVTLEKVLYIQYIIYIKKNKIQTLFDSGNKVNRITLIFAIKLNIKIQHINVEAQKIDGFIFEIFRIVLANFWVKDLVGFKILKNCFY